MTFSALNISGLKSVRLAMSIAVGYTGSTGRWEEDDFFHANIHSDGVPSTDAASGYGLWIESDYVNKVGTKKPAVDTNHSGFPGDGVSPGQLVTGTFATFSVDVPVSGTTADVVLTWKLDGSSEDLVVDNVLVTAVAVPEPLALGAIVLLMTMLLRRCRKSREEHLVLSREGAG
jgi:hypothetical protein